MTIKSTEKEIVTAAAIMALICCSLSDSRGKLNTIHLESEAITDYRFFLGI